MARTLGQWNALKPSYRTRLQRSGITADHYVSGASLAKGRGHAKTPESPRKYNPLKYPEYHVKRTASLLDPKIAAYTNFRNQLDAALEEHKITDDNLGKMDYSGVFIAANLDNTDALTLNRIASMSYDEIAAKARADSKRGVKSSPYWYHS